MGPANGNLTQGSVFKKLWWFTLPFIGANVLQSLYSMVDMYIVGRFATTADVSAVSVSGTVIATFLMFIIGLSIGATVIVGQKIGAGEKDSLQSVCATAFTLALIVGAALVVIIAALAVPVLGWINTPKEAMHGATAYMLICSIGFLFQSVYNMLAGILRGMGDSKSPLLFVGISTAFNIIGDIILIGVCGLGAAGAAIATVLAQLLCMIFGILYVKKRGFPFDFRFKNWRLEKTHVKSLLKVGVPVALQEFLVMFSFIIIAGINNRFGLNASAGAGILDKIFVFATIPTFAFNSSIAAMVAQNIGAKEQKRAVQCLIYGALLSEAFAIVFFLLGLLIPDKVVGFFTTDAGVIKEGVAYFGGNKYEYLLCSLAFCINGFINGTGHTKISLIGNVVSTYVVRIPACIIVGVVMNLGLLGVGYTFPFASFVQALIGLIFILSGRWKRDVVSIDQDVEGKVIKAEATDIPDDDIKEENGSHLDNDG